MERQDTMAYILSRGLFDVIPLVHANEKEARDNLFTYLWSNCWEDDPDKEMIEEVQLTKWNKVGKQQRLLQRMMELKIFSYKNNTLTLEAMGQTLLYNARKEIIMHKLEQLNSDRIEKLELKQAEQAILLTDVNDKMVSLINQVNILKRSLLNPV